MKKSAIDNYAFLEHIGSGSYAKVNKAVDKRTGEICAIKKISVASEFDNLRHEIGILSNCECKNIVRFLDSDCSGEEVFIVMEYCCGGSVKDVMNKLGRTMTEEQIIVITRDVLNGLDYLHSKNKIHRDVKAANILLNEEGIAKICDFGVSEPLDASTRKQSIIGTLLWLPPEVINRDRNYSSVIDIWSLGITIIEMADRKPPYSDIDQKAALIEIADLNIPSGSFRDQSKWSQNLKHFLSLCLEKNASKRKSAKELLNHDLFINAPSNEIIKSLVNEVERIEVIMNSVEPEKNLYKACQYLWKENEVLLGIYGERTKKVVRVDKLTKDYKSLRGSFEKLFLETTRRNQEVNELIAQSKFMVNEIHKLEREKNELESSLRRYENRKFYFLGQLSAIRNKLKESENDELIRRRKLSLLKN